MNAFVGIDRSTANVSLAFLRDIFVCTLLLGPLYWAFRLHAVVGVAFTLGLYLIGTPLLLSPYLLLFYALGVYLAHKSLWPTIPASLEVLSWIIVAGLGVIITALQLETVARPEQLTPAMSDMLEALYLAIRLPAAIAMLATLSRLMRNGAFSALMLRASPYIFVIYCSHVVTLTLAWAVWQKVVGGYNSDLYPVFFYLGAPMACAGGIVFAVVESRTVPGLLKVLNGGRPILSRMTRPGRVVAPRQIA